MTRQRPWVKLKHVLSNLSLLRTSSGRKNTSRTRINCITTGSPYITKNATHTSTTRLPNHTFLHHHQLSCECHGAHRPQWCIIPLQSQITKQSRMTLLHDRRICGTPKQQSSDQNFTNYQDLNVVCNWGRTVRTIYQLPRSRLRDNYSGRNGSQTAANANANRQYNRSWRGQRQHCKQKVEVNGNVNQLAVLQRGIETIPALLEAGTY